MHKIHKKYIKNINIFSCIFFFYIACFSKVDIIFVIDASSSGSGDSIFDFVSGRQAISDFINDIIPDVGETNRM